MTTVKADIQAADRVIRAAVRHSITAIRAGAERADVAGKLEHAGEAAALLMERPA